MSFLISPGKSIGKTGPSKAWTLENTAMVANQRVAKSRDEGNLAFIGNTGSGKSTLLESHMRSCVKYIPDYMTTVNAVVYSPKNDLLPLLRNMGLPLKVISANVLDPGGWAWRMDEDITDPIAAEQAVLDMLPDEREGSENKFYSVTPRHIFAAVISELVRSDRSWTLREAYILAMNEFYAKQLISRSRDEKTRQVLSFFNENQGSTKANIHSSLVTKLGNIANYAMLMERCRGSFSIKNMVRGEQVLVMGSDFRYSHILGPMNNLMINVAKRELLSQPDSRTRRHYVWIDEFPKLNSNRPADEFTDFVEVGRSRGVRVVIVMQSTRQLVDLYGAENANILIGQCLNKVILRQGDYDGATDCSNLLGHVHGYEWTRNTSEGSSRTSSSQGGSSTWNLNVGASEVWANRPLVHPSELLDLPLASWTKGFSGYGICPALAKTKRWRFDISPEWIKEHIIEPRLTFEVEGNDHLWSFPEPPPRDMILRPLTRDEAERLDLVFDPNGYRP